MNESTDNRKVGYHEFSALKHDITDMKSLMSRMVEAMSRITIIEERQHTLNQNSTKTLERIEEITERQHNSEMVNAANAAASSKIETLEESVRVLKTETAVNKARFETVVWLVRGAWAVIGSGGAIWLFQSLMKVPG